MNPPVDNAAALLRSVLETLRNLPSNNSSAEAWSVVLGTPLADTMDLISAIAKANELALRAERSLADLGAASPVSLGWIEPVRAALIQSTELGRPLRLVKHHLTDSTMLSLQACEETIGSPHTAINHSHIEEAIRLTDELLTTLHEANLEAKAHELMTRHILALQQALKLYPIVGATGLYDEMISTLAALNIVARPEDEKKGWYQRFRFWMTELADMITTGQAIANGVSDATRALPPGLTPFN